METTESTLADLKAGDVAYVKTSGYQPIRRVTITKVTSTQIVTNNGDRYRKVDGNRIGSSDRWTFYTLKTATPEIIAAYQRQENLRTVKAARWENLDDDTLAKVAALLPKKEEQS